MGRGKPSHSKFSKAVPSQVNSEQYFFICIYKRLNTVKGEGISRGGGLSTLADLRQHFMSTVSKIEEMFTFGTVMQTSKTISGINIASYFIMLFYRRNKLRMVKDMSKTSKSGS